MKKAIKLPCLIGIFLLIPVDGGSAAGDVGAPGTKGVRLDTYGDALPEGAIGRLGTTRFRHGFNARGIAYAPDGATLASAGRLPGLCLFDAKTGRLLHRRDATAFAPPAFSPDSKAVFTGQSLIDIVTGEELRTFDAPGANVGASAAYSPNGSTVASGSFDSVNASVVLWDAATGQERRRLRGHRGEVAAIAFSPKNSNLLASAGRDKTVRLWNTNTGKQIHLLEWHDRAVLAVVFSPDGKTLASTGEDRTIRIWDVASGKQIRQMNSFSPNSLAFSPDGKRLANSADLSGTIHLWNPETGQEIRHWETPGYVNSVAFSPDGKVLALAAGCAVLLCDPDTGKEINPLARHQGIVQAMQFTTNGKSLLSCGRDRQMLSWNLASSRATGRFAGLLKQEAAYWNPADIANDGTVLAQASFVFDPQEQTYANSTIHLWEVSTGKQLQSFFKHKGFVRSLKLSPDSKLLASSERDGIRLWSVASGEERHFLHKGTFVSGFAFTPDGTRLILAGNDNMLRCSDVLTGKELRRWRIGHSANVLAMSSDGRLIAAGGGGTISVWTVDTANKIAEFGVQSQRFSLVFSGTARVLASGGIGPSEESSSVVQLWEIPSSQQIRRLDTQQAFVNALALTPDGRTLATGGADSTILLWDLTGRANVKRAPATAKQLDEWWSHLRADAAKADAAVWALTLAPEQSMPYLKERLRATPPADEKQLAKLLADLDNTTFSVRQKAERELITLGESAEAALRKTLTKGLSLETRRRIEQVLDKRGPDVLRLLRAIDVLEQIGAPESRQILRALAGVTVNPRVAQAAETACTRLAQR